MAEKTGISWCDATFNPWIGCQKVSPGCDHCYAETLMDGRFGVVNWGPGAPRRRTKLQNWNMLRRLNRKAAAAGVRFRVFCASLADVFDNAVDPAWRVDLWALIRETPHLDWLLLTKRPQNIAKRLPVDWGNGWANVWLGTSVENQEEADRRIPHLLTVPAAVRFLSCEPLLGPVDLAFSLSRNPIETASGLLRRGMFSPSLEKLRPIDWVIVGGESGTGARPMHPDWARELRYQCAAAGVPFFFKQWGEHDETGARVGKRAAGDLLDGAQHHAWPSSPAVTVELAHDHTL